MVFNSNDIYTGSGSAKVFNTWTPYVSKFDTSSFYNWEQDNLPLYDLEERTYELWEQAGFPTSAVPGIAFTVSGDAPAAHYEANPNTFTTVSACIAAMPKVIRFPILIEVGNIGDLGSLELHNFKIEEGGSIEIVNRAFGQTLNASSDVRSRYATGDLTYNKTHTAIQNFSSLDLSNTLTDSSCLDISTPVLRNTITALDSRVQGEPVASMVLYPSLSLKRGMTSVSIKRNDFFQNLQNEYLSTPYERAVNIAVDNTLATLDVSSKNQNTELLTLRGGVVANDLIAGNCYFNYFKKISVRNCNGPVFIRNFFVDAETEGTIGIEVINSDVVLEHCTAVRAKEAGFKFDNSRVVLSRHAAAYRNYSLSTTTTRNEELGVGFHAVNSDVSISALPVTTLTNGAYEASGRDINIIASRNTYGFKFENSNLRGGFTRTNVGSEITGGLIMSELNTSAGINAFNSKVDVKGLIDVYGNYRGIEAKNSSFKFENINVEHHSEEGLVADNSNFIYDSSRKPGAAGQTARNSVLFQYNSQDLVLRNQSSFSFASKDHVPELYGNCRFGNSHGVNTWTDGKGNLATISVEDGSTADLLHAVIFPRHTADAQANVPMFGLAARAVNGSKLSFFGSKTGATLIMGPSDYSYQKLSAGVYADKQSSVNFHGPTAIAQFGVDVLVEDQSTLNIEPPRKSDSWALDASAFDLLDPENHTAVELHSTRSCLVANKNSKINLRDLGAWPALWVNGSTGIGVVAAGTDDDLLNFGTSALFDHGGLQFYPNPQHSTGITTNNLDDVSAALSVADLNVDIPTFSKGTSALTYIVKDNPLSSPTISDRAKVSIGGMCVRAAEDSTVNVQNVHFVHGNQSSPLDGAYYDASGDLCNRLMIWNIADTSRLNAAYCSVSGAHPYDSSYNGPSAIWVSSYDGLPATTEYVPASGAPKSTPDTGTLSVLDEFGAGSAVHVIPSGVSYHSVYERFYSLSDAPHINDATARNLVDAGINVSSLDTRLYGAPVGTVRNKGVFRIYFSVDPAAKYLAHDLSGFKHGAPGGADFSGRLGVVPQIFAQGYNMSAPVSATQLLGTAAEASSFYSQLVKLSYDDNGDGTFNDVHASGFYYAKEFVRDDPNQCMLDESAAATFANAKSASTGTSGKPKKVTVYNSGGATQDENKGAESFEHEEAIGIRSFNIFDLERDN